MSVLSGLSDFFGAAGYNKDKLTAVASHIVSSYLGQGIPTVGGKIARSFDDTSRQTYYDPNKTGIIKEADVFRQKAQAKIPGLANQLEPRVDLWGREQKNVGGSFAGRLAYNMLSPGYYSVSQETEVDRELQKLYEATGESSVLPNTAYKSFDLPDNGGEVKLSTGEYTQFAKERGSKAYDIFEELIDTRAYKAMSNEQKIDAAKQIYAYATAVAKSNVSDYELQDTAAKIQKCEKADIPAGVAIVAYIAQKEAKGDKDANGNTISLSASRNKKAAIDKNTPFLNKKQRELLYDLFGVSEKVW